MELARRRFRAMGTTCELAVTVASHDEPHALRALAAGLAEIKTCERVLTRFDSRSDLSRLNVSAGTWVDVDPRLLAALRAAVRARRVTGGRFDPTILPPLLAAGYDRTFEQLAHRPPTGIEGWQAGAEISIDEDECRVRLAPGAAVDLGGIGKGLSAAWALEAMRMAWPAHRGAFADLGGDLAFHGLAPGAGAWRVAVADPRDPGGTLATLELAGGGVATSGRDRRRFGPGRSLHHLIDPNTGHPAAQGPLAVTVVAADAGEAESLATAFAISDLDEVRRQIDTQLGVSALYVSEAGPPVIIGPLPLARRYRLEVAA